MIPLFKSMLVNGNVIRPNYKNEMIPVGMGNCILTNDYNKQYNIRFCNIKQYMVCKFEVTII